MFVVNCKILQCAAKAGGGMARAIQNHSDKISLLIKAGWFTEGEFAVELGVSPLAVTRWLGGITEKFQHGKSDLVIPAACALATKAGRQLCAGAFDSANSDLFAIEVGIRGAVASERNGGAKFDLGIFRRASATAVLDAESYSGCYFVYRASETYPDKFVKVCARIYLEGGVLLYEDHFDKKMEYRGYVVPTANILNIFGEEKHSLNGGELFWCGLRVSGAWFRGWVTDTERKTPEVERIAFIKVESGVWEDAKNNVDNYVGEQGLSPDTGINAELVRYLRNEYIKDSHDTRRR